MDTVMDRDAMLGQLLAWATSEDNVRAAVLTGSAARGAADSYSDLDIELYVRDPAPLLDQDRWYQSFGTVLVVEALENEGWNPTRLVYYAGGKIDFTILSVSLFQDGVDFDRPFRILVDKDDQAGALRVAPQPPTAPPTEGEFRTILSWFYAAVIMWAKYLARDDPLAAKVRDRDSKAMLLQMLEWDHKARKGWSYDTWYLGIHLRAWLDPELFPAIAASWCGLDPRESVRAVRASLDLFGLLSTRTAHALGYAPFDSAAVREEIERLLEGLA